MRGILDHPWMKVLLVATAVAMVSFALRETASITLPVISALQEVLIPLAIGFTVAYILTPAVDWLCRRGLSRLVATTALYAGFTAVLAVGLVFLVPAMVGQGKDLIQRTFVGETWTDRDGNRQWTPGEAFVDSNRNGRWDPGFITRAGAWVAERQRDLRGAVGAGVGAPELAFLARYADAVAPARTRLDHALHAGEPPPAPPATAPAAWDPRWPGAAADRVAAILAGPDGERRRPAVAAAGAALAAAHAEQLAVLRAARAEGDADPAAAALRAAWAEPDPAALAAGGTALGALEADERAGIAAAAELLRELRGGDEAARPLVRAMDDIEAAARDWVDQLPGRIGAWVGTWVGSVGEAMSLLLSVLLVPIYAFFLTLGMPQVRTAAKSYLPTPHRERILRLAHDIERVVAAFFRGRLIICTLCAMIGVAGFYACALFGVGVPYAFLFGTLIGFATVIPMAGLLFLAPALAMTMMEPGAGALHIGLVLGVYVLIQTAEAILIPVVMGREVELHPVTLIVALLLCGKLLGVLGLILAVPIFASARILAREFLWPWLRRWAERLPQPPAP